MITLDYNVDFWKVTQAQVKSRSAIHPFFCPMVAGDSLPEAK
jgi:hypothetical protein